MDSATTRAELSIADAVPASAEVSLEGAFRQYAPYVATIALRLLGRNGEVDDLVQDVFLSAISGLRQLREPAAITGWLATVTVRMARRRLRRRRFWAVLGFDEAIDYSDVAAPSAPPEDRALLARVYAALDGLPVELRLAWSLRHLEGERLEAVAGHCGCSLATAKRRIAAAQTVIERLVSDA